MEIYDVFISYRRSDGTELADAVAESLRSKGLSVFFDTKEIKSGEDFTLRIEGALRQAPNYLLIATPDVFKFRTEEKDWVFEEMRIACENYKQDLDKNRMYTFVVPKYVYRYVNPDDPSKGKRREDVQLPKAETWPEEIFDLSKSNWIALRSDLPDVLEQREILSSVTRVTRHNMWNAGRRWLLENRKEGRRFASLDITKTIFPRAVLQETAAEEEEDEDFPALVMEQEAPSAEPAGEKLPLFDALKKTENHVYLVGEGGIGKTTSLIHVMEEAYKERDYTETAQIPLFVELSKAPDTAGRLYANGKSTFIRRSIYRQVRMDRTVKKVTEAEVGALDEVFRADPETAVTPINALLTDEHKPPEYLLLLDGLNEVSRTELEIPPKDEEGNKIGDVIKIPVIQMIIEEINDLMKYCSNVRVILTGRADEPYVNKKEVTRFQLTGIDDDSMKKYLEGKIHREEAAEIFKNRILLETLRVPLFLTMFLRLKEKHGITTQGEILHAFFTEKTKQLTDYDVPYNMRNRIGQIEGELSKSASAKQGKRLSAEMQSFMIDFLLSVLGRYMEENDLFSVDTAAVEKIILPVLDGTQTTDVCGLYGKEAFPRYKNTKAGSVTNTATAADALKRVIGMGQEAAETFCLLCSSVLGILVDDGQYHYSFIHQHIRDYFAALHIMNKMWIAVVCNMKDRNAAYDFINGEIDENPIGFTVRRMLGEMLGEHYNRPTLNTDGNWHYNVPDKPCNRSLIKHTLEVYRNHFVAQNWVENGYGLWNLIQILKEVREDLSGEDFSRLDLIGIRLHSFSLGNKGCSAILFGSKMDKELYMPGGHTGWVDSAFSPDGKRIVIASRKNTAEVWDAENSRIIGELEGHTDHVSSTVYSQDGERIVTTSSDQTARVWEAETFHEIGILEGHNDHVNSVAYSPDGTRLVTASRDKTAKVWDNNTFCEIGTLKGHTNWVNSAVFSPDGKKIVTASSDSKAKVWDSDSFREIATLNGHKGWVTSSVYSPDGKRIVTTSSDETAIIWDAATYREIGKLKGHTSWVNAAAFSLDGKRIVTVSRDETVKVWDAENCQEISTLAGHTIWVNSVTFSPDGKTFLTVSWDKNVKIWDAESLIEIGTIKGYEDFVTSAVFSPDGNRILMSSVDKSAKIWDSQTFREIGIMKGHADNIKNAAYSPDGKRIITVSEDKTAKIWDAESLEKIVTLTGHTKDIETAIYSPDGKLIVTVTNNKVIAIWDAETFFEIRTLEEHAQEVNSAIISPDGRRIVAALSDGTVKVWDVITSSEIRKLEGHSHAVNSVAYSPDGKRIITASKDNTAKIWDAETFQLIMTLIGHEQELCSAAYSPDGTRIITTSDDCSTKVWDASTYQELGTLKGHTGRVNTAFYNNNQELIITASSDGTAKIWDANTFECLHTIRNVPGLEVVGCDFRNLHPDSKLSDEDKQLLWEYGARFNDADTPPCGGEKD